MESKNEIDDLRRRQLSAAERIQIAKMLRGDAKQPEIAEEANVSVRQLQRLERVEQSGNKGLQELARNATITLVNADKIAQLPPEEQKVAVRQVKEAVRKGGDGNKAAKKATMPKRSVDQELETMRTGFANLTARLTDDNRQAVTEKFLKDHLGSKSRVKSDERLVIPSTGSEIVEVLKEAKQSIEPAEFDRSLQEFQHKERLNCDQIIELVLNLPEDGIQAVVTAAQRALGN